jgi:hypothetical protein
VSKIDRNGLKTANSNFFNYIEKIPAGPQPSPAWLQYAELGFNLFSGFNMPRPRPGLKAWPAF